ncbi:hypothetical protein [Acidihalobacter ferrooxydans]|uniref:Uncharacterized protein n=1 Tax=Acidihalobacter ferrooxydans TaxID=1765967 RepID=A0A1P8UHJ2_9GAMM|nr:hypothetical protein [Acidihalobacter ferrooxydans]APZ43251.1 hypothetical protein BW247_09220 [Acidihalobacter ferrooxydans]
MSEKPPAQAIIPTLRDLVFPGNQTSTRHRANGEEASENIVHDGSDEPFILLPDTDDPDRPTPHTMPPAPTTDQTRASRHEDVLAPPTTPLQQRVSPPSDYSIEEIDLDELLSDVQSQAPVPAPDTTQKPPLTPIEMPDEPTFSESATAAPDETAIRAAVREVLIKELDRLTDRITAALAAHMRR